MQTFVRVREQMHSNLLGFHIDSLAGETADRLLAYRGAVRPHSRLRDRGDPGDEAPRQRRGPTSLRAGVHRRVRGRGSGRVRLHPPDGLQDPSQVPADPTSSGLFNKFAYNRLA